MDDKSCLNILKNFKIDKNNIYTNGNKGRNISYSKKGNQKCFQVEDASFWFKHRNNCILSTIKRFPPRGPIIDLGGGNGFVAKRLIDEGYETILIEPGYKGAVNAKKKRLIPKVISSTFENAKFPPESLDAVCMFDVIEHIKDDKKIINLIYKTLKPNGMIYITVPANQYLWSNHDIQAEHFRRYDQVSINKIVKSRFKLLYSSYFFQPLIIPMFIFRVIPFYLGFMKKRRILSRQAEHGNKNSFVSKIISYFLNSELKTIKQGRTIKTGTSLVLVGQK